MKVGYARVSMQDQNLDHQIDALKKAGCEKIFSDKISGSKSERNGLEGALEYIKAGDIFTVYKLDRLGRSLMHLVDLMNNFKEKGIQFVSLTENIDTSTPTGKLTFYIFAALSEFVRDSIRERTAAGLAAARARGRVGGRPKALKGKTLDMFLNLAKDPANKPEDICRMAKISIATFYRYKQKVSA